MFKKIFKFVSKHKFIFGVVVLVMISAGYFGYKALNSKTSDTRYVLASVEKGTITISVSGSGQVTALDQIEIKPKVSGDIAALYFKKDQEVKAGQLLVELDSKGAQKAVRDAQASLNEAKAKLDELVSQPDTESLLQAKNALAQAERDLNKEKVNYNDISIAAERSLAAAYEDGYSAVSTSFFKLSDYTKDLKDVMGNEESEQKYISHYRLMLGSDSLFIQKLLEDYYKANDFFGKNFIFFRGTYRNDERDTIYRLIGDTLETTEAISQALESARHMFDAIVVGNYSSFTIASHVDKMQPKIESDISSVYTYINSLQKIKDTIDDTNKNTPTKIEDARLSIQSAQEKSDEKKLALDELMSGANPQDIESQRNVVAQKEDALLDAKEKLVACSIRVPFDGVIASFDENTKKGDSVSSGTSLATLITKQKIAEITLNEVDIAKVKVDQKTTITFDAIEDLTITGKVMEINTVGTVSQGVVTYGVKIAFDMQDERVKPGMSLSTTIITNVKQDTLIVQNSAVKSQGGSYYVELPENQDINMQAAASLSGIILTKLPNQKTVEVGISNDQYTEIISGLNQGDAVVVSTISSQSKTNSTNNTQQRSSGFGIPATGGGGNFR